MQNQIPFRKDVLQAHTWDLSSLFKDDGHWKKEFEAFPSTEKISQDLVTLRQKMFQTGADLHQLLNFRDQLFRKLEGLYNYAFLRNAEDVGNPQTSTELTRMLSKYTEVGTLFAFINPEITSHSDLVQKWIQEEPLNSYQYQLSEILRLAKHVLSEKEEQLIEKLSEPLSKFSEVHSKWNNVDIKYRPAKDSKGNEHLVTAQRMILNLSAKDSDLRKDSFHSMYEEISKWRHTIAANFAAHLKRGSVLAELRNFSSFRESQLSPDGIPTTVYDALIADTRKHLPLLHRSMKLRKNVLKLDGVAPYDRYVSLCETVEPRFTWDQAVTLILAALKPLGEEYLSIAKRGLTTERWCDYAENQGKRGGAFSSGTYDSYPYMMMTWTGTLENVFTLAHELGHSMHSYFSNKNQPYHNAGYPIFLAEVASTLNEHLLAQHITNEEPNSDLAKQVVSHKLNGFEGTHLRQTLFATFERDVCELSDKGEPLTADSMETIHYNLNKEWYGPDSTYPDYIKHEWMRIPHFYNTFYVYKYATSYCASLALAQQLGINPKDTQKAVLKFLKSGGSRPSLDIMLDAGIDFLNPETVGNAFKVYESDIQKAEKLFL